MNWAETCTVSFGSPWSLNATTRPIVTFCSYDKPGSVGGPFSWLRRLLPLLRTRGIDCRCLFLTHFGGTGPIVEGLREDGFDCRVVDCHERTEDQVRWVLEQLHENPPDVFVPNLVVSAYHAARWVRAAGIPTVGILHSDDPYYRAIQDQFLFGARDLQLSSVVCVSQELERQVKLRSPANSIVARIPYGVSIPAFISESTPDRFRIAYVGRLAEEQKQISELTRAFIRVCRTIPDADAVIYGDGPDRCNVEAILATEGQDLRVRLAGNIPNDRIQHELLQCDVIALLSDYEGLPIALLEAMACGCVPVCLSMQSGIPELIQDGINGIIVTNRESSFTTAIQRLRNDVEFRDRLSLNARKTVSERFSDDAAADLWAAHLRSLKPSRAAKVISIPRKLSLPPRNAALESEPMRATPTSNVQLFFRRTRMLAGRLRRQLLGLPIDK